jgi:hypothetical protein
MQAETDDARWQVWAVWSPPLREAQVEVRLDRARFNAAALPAAAAARADELWTNLLARNPRLFSALKFRLALVETRAPYDAPVTARLGVGLTDYKAFLTTNRAEDAAMVAALPRPVEPVLAMSLGCGALIVTADGAVVFHRRSFRVSEFRGWWDCPGGHAEPKNAQITREGGPDAGDEGARARTEIFRAMLDEVHDEINVPYETMEQPLLLGIVRHCASRLRPCAMFLVRTSLSSQQLGAAFSAGGKEADESTSIALFAGDVVARGAGPATLVALPPRPPDAKPIAPVDQPTCFEDLGATLVPSAAFVVDYIRKYGLPVPAP